MAASDDRAATSTVNVEYVSANPTGPMHVGHCRGAVFGDALANLLAFAGFEVTREYYINDAGAQVDALARSAYLRYREALGENDRRDPGRALSRRLPQAGRRSARGRVRRRAQGQAGVRVAARRCARKAIAMMMDMIRDDLAALNVRHDVFFSERSLIEGGDKVGATIEALREEGRRLRRPAAAAERNDRTRTRKTASRRCSAPPSSATTSTGR